MPRGGVRERTRILGFMKTADVSGKFVDLNITIRFQRQLGPALLRPAAHEIFQDATQARALA